ncbi:MAG: hypothetical protein INR69_03765 [Mucilaginibacter polytrichastri]|nr:hypothetical protein [Mucilaginibacter polytrichastri]
MFLCFLFFSVSPAHAQVIPRYNPDTVRTIVIDTPVVNIVARKINVQRFIDEMLNDTSFYLAFRNMKKYSFIAENRIFTYDKKNKVDAKLYRRIRHSNVAGAHKMQYLAKRDSGKIFKRNGKYQLYTVEMFDYIFMNAYNSDFADGPSIGDGKGGSNEGYKAKLKTLIFQPGRPIKGVPFISGKTEIFQPPLNKYYTYQFSKGRYLDSIPVFRFKVIPRSDLGYWEKDKLMIKELTTIFDARTFQIMGRYIDMKFDNMFVDFDVQMNIELGNFDGDLLPTKITYQGNWNIPFKKEERASFLILHKDYKKE